jgi:hypothetical protein
MHIEGQPRSINAKRCQLQPIDLSLKSLSGL